MDPTVVVILTWVVAAAVVALYIWFLVWRYRVDRRKKAAQALTDAAMSDAIAKTAERVTSASTLGARPEPRRAPASEPAPVPAAPAPPSAPQAGPSGATVAARLTGIVLPHDLAPLTTMASRAAVGDRVAFWTSRAPATIVGPAFADELERLGYSVTSLDPQSLAARRGDDRLLVVIHPDGPAALIDGQPAFTSVPEQSVVIEVWLPVL